VPSGASAGASEVWRHRRFGNACLENAALYDDGSSSGLAALLHRLFSFDLTARYRGTSSSGADRACGLTMWATLLGEYLYFAR
jgi:hypothetical protein